MVQQSSRRAAMGRRCFLRLDDGDSKSDQSLAAGPFMPPYPDDCTPVRSRGCDDTMIGSSTGVMSPSLPQPTRPRRESRPERSDPVCCGAAYSPSVLVGPPSGSVPLFRFPQDFHNKFTDPSTAPARILPPRSQRWRQNAAMSNCGVSATGVASDGLSADSRRYACISRVIS